MHYIQCWSTVIENSMWAQRNIQILISNWLSTLQTNFEVTAQYVLTLCHSLEELSTKPFYSTVNFILAAFEEFNLKTPFRSVSFLAALMKAICQMFLLSVIKGEGSFTLHDTMRNQIYCKCMPIQVSVRFHFKGHKTVKGPIYSEVIFHSLLRGKRKLETFAVVYC